MLRVGPPSLTQTNGAFHRMLRDGVPVEDPRPNATRQERTGRADHSQAASVEVNLLIDHPAVGDHDHHAEHRLASRRVQGGKPLPEKAPA